MENPSACDLVSGIWREKKGLMEEGTTLTPKGSD